MDVLLFPQKGIKNTCAIKISRRYLTVLELLIALAIVALIGGAVAFPVRHFYVQQKTLTEMGEVAAALKAASDLNVVAGLDANVKFDTDAEGHLVVSLMPISGVYDFLKGFVKKSVVTVPFIQEIRFTDAFTDKQLTPPFELTFAAKGFVMNRGTLLLQGEKTTRYLFLMGYPTPLSFTLSEKEQYPATDLLQKEVEAVTLQTALLTASADE